MRWGRGVLTDESIIHMRQDAFGSTRPEIRLLLLTVLCTRWGRGVLTDESIIHMRQDAFLLVEGIGLISHVPGLHGAPLPEKGMTAYTWVLPQSMVCPV